jgi:uroporphyrinogen-III synthase
MQQNKIRILSTKLLNDEVIRQASVKNVLIEWLPFIKTEAVSSIEVQQEIEQALMLSASVVFTSVNAVEAVAAQLESQKPDWQIFCIDYATCESVENYFGKELISGTADSAKELADVILRSNVEEVIFFCGDQRRDELPGSLRENEIEVDEIVVYETLALHQKIDKEYNGILFFSPSAVLSFFHSNRLNDQTILFAIGNTTANEIIKHSKNKVIVSDKPDQKILLEKVINYFQANPIHN